MDEIGIIDLEVGDKMVFIGLEATFCPEDTSSDSHPVSSSSGHDIQVDSCLLLGYISTAEREIDLFKRVKVVVPWRSSDSIRVGDVHAVDVIGGLTSGLSSHDHIGLLSGF